MNWLIYLKTAFINLNRNKFRTFLIFLGIIMGIASVVSIYTIGIGFKEGIKEEFESLGSNTLIIFPFKIEEQKGFFSSKSYESIKIKDIIFIKNNFKEVSMVMLKAYTSAKISFKNNFIDRTAIIGTTPDFFLIGEKPLAGGSYFGETDVSKASQVCVLGAGVAETLFLNQNPVDNTVLINQIPFRVIGVFEKKPRGFYFGNLDREVITPYTSMERRLQGERNPDIFEARLVIGPQFNILDTKDKTIRFLRQLKKVPADKEEGFTVTTPDEFTKIFKDLISNYILFLSIVAFISLLIGGIGIMNIMLVTVAERTKEIGIRTAVGAKESDITLQFLIEAVILCLVGGILGIFLGILGSYFISKSLQYPTKVSWEIVFIALFYALVVGVIFGYYPAKRAASLDPIEALRLE